MDPRSVTRLTRLAVALATATLLLVAACSSSSGTTPPPPGKSTAGTQPAGSGTATDDGFDKTAHSTTKASSIWVVVNKKHTIKPLHYAPKLTTVDGKEIGKVMAPALRKLLAASARHGTPLHVVSGYRSYDYQVEVYNRNVATNGKAHADRYSARPGHSEHQTGLAADLDNISSSCVLEPCFGQTPGGKWLARHAANFGFIIRYTPANTKITGYNPEPWHVRYVGIPLAKEMKKTHIDSLEEFFGISGGNYPKK